MADAVVEGLGDFFVGERVRVRIAVDERETIFIPAAFIDTRYGVDYVRVQTDSGTPHDVVVQRGEIRNDAVEILSGLSAGDVLVQP